MKWSLRWIDLHDFWEARILNVKRKRRYFFNGFHKEFIILSKMNLKGDESVKN